MTTFSDRLQDIAATISAARLTSPYQQEVQLLAVSKSQPAAAIRAGFLCGQTRYGENYVQEALEKQAALSDLEIEWHFIGPIQSNKTQAIAQHFNWVHSVDREKIAQRLNDARPEHLPPLQVCIQVNISDEASKSGAGINELELLAQKIWTLPRLKLRGLMAIPAPSEDVDEQHRQFQQVRECYDSLVRIGFDLDTLSIGMSNDYPIAVQYGATIVRIGSALFGARAKKSTQIFHENLPVTNKQH
ncbi:MAG: YggS family pyridoxal phosphate-dependent enzyme [Betaproteobacteria bacterium]|nr:YggS family pyridoxal phosphate-dependent enzyme [Betaproteobacteria bacterium]